MKYLKPEQLFYRTSFLPQPDNKKTPAKELRNQIEYWTTLRHLGLMKIIQFEKELKRRGLKV